MNTLRSRASVPLLALAIGITLAHPSAQSSTTPDAVSTPLVATVHPPLAADPLQLWLAPAGVPPRSSALARFRTGVQLLGEARHQEALPLLATPLAGTPLADYATYYTGLAHLRLSRFDAAEATFGRLLARPRSGYLSDAVRIAAAEVAEARGDYRRAKAAYSQLAEGRPLAPQDVLMRLARAALADNDARAAATAWARVYYEFPTSPEAPVARQELDRRQFWEPLTAGSARYAFELGRAKRLFGARRYEQAREAFDLLKPLASGDDGELVALRIAESDHYLGRYAAARAALEPYVRRASRKAEAQFFYLTATRELGAHDEYVRLSRELVAAWPRESWAEETLNNLGTHYIKANEDQQAAGVFNELLGLFPDGRHAARAAWKAGWWAYKNGRYDETVRIFEQAAARMPRSDYRPSWVYWSARSHDRLGHRDIAHARYALVVTDYQNSYYGRISARLLGERGAPAVVPVAASRSEPHQAAPLPGTHQLVRTLIAHELYGDALNELRYAQQMWGDSPAIQATIGLVTSRLGDRRGGINAMKRAYPQYIAAGGERLPDEMMKVLFPVAYWDIIRRHSAARGLDPYLVAALIAQESTFEPAIRSHANAVGLMQIVPATGRRYARRVGIRRFRAAMLVNPEINVRLGTTIFADVTRRFGGTHLALASYNAGESAVARWVAERPGIARDEFIDDIPYPETQNYVKKILGTAEDYRRLYGGVKSTPASASDVKRAVNDGAQDRVTPASNSAPTQPAKKGPPTRSRSRR